MSNVLKLSSVFKTYNIGQANQIEVLQGANLEIKESEMVALVAPSGAGKSTLLHIAGLLDTLDKGKIEIAGIDLSKSRDYTRTKARLQEIGFVYQFHHLLPEFSAVENVMLPQLQNNVSRKQALERAEELLALVGLAERGSHRPATLSGGEQQRVALCRAVANEPKLLIADEPTGNLDPETSVTVFEVLKKLISKTGMAALIATHNIELADRLDRKVSLVSGKIF